MNIFEEKKLLRMKFNRWLKITPILLKKICIHIHEVKQ